MGKFGTCAGRHTFQDLDYQPVARDFPLQIFLNLKTCIEFQSMKFDFFTAGIDISSSEARGGKCRILHP